MNFQTPTNRSTKPKHPSSTSTTLTLGISDIESPEKDNNNNNNNDCRSPPHKKQRTISRFSRKKPKSNKKDISAAEIAQAKANISELVTKQIAINKEGGTRILICLSTKAQGSAPFWKNYRIIGEMHDDGVKYTDFALCIVCYGEDKCHVFGAASYSAMKRHVIGHQSGKILNNNNNNNGITPITKYIALEPILFTKEEKEEVILKLVYGCIKDYFHFSLAQKESMIELLLTVYNIGVKKARIAKYDDIRRLTSIKLVLIIFYI